MLLVLFALILRPIGFKYRSKVNNPVWRHAWDFALFLGGFVPALVFGVAIGNILQGVPFYFDKTLHLFYTGTLLDLFNPFALLCGAVSVVMLSMHGGVYLANKTTDKIQQRAIRYAIVGAVILVVLFAVAGIWVTKWIPGFLVSSMPHDAPSNPLYKHVVLRAGAWLKNYELYPSLITVPALGFVGAVWTIILLIGRHFKVAWLASALSVASVVATVGISMFPFLLPSSSHPNMSLLVWDASSSKTTLLVMLISAGFFIPLIMAYTGWVYRVLRGKVTADYIESNQSNVY